MCFGWARRTDSIASTLGHSRSSTSLPIGLIQLSGALEQGYWYARSADLMQKPIIQLLGWMRVPGDTIFSVGALALAWFVASLWIAPREAKAPATTGTALPPG